MKLKELEKSKIPVEIGGAKMYLRYNLNSYRYLEEYYAGGIHELMKKDISDWSLTDTMHLLRAGLIDFNFEKNEKALNSGEWDKIVPTMGTLGKLMNEENVSMLSGQILMAMIDSMPVAPIGAEANPTPGVQK